LKRPFHLLLGNYHVMHAQKARKVEIKVKQVTAL